MKRRTFLLIPFVPLLPNDEPLSPEDALRFFTKMKARLQEVFGP